MAAQRREMEMQAGEKRAAALQADLQDVRYRQEQEVAKAAQRRAEDEEASESTGRLAREKLEKVRLSLTLILRACIFLCIVVISFSVVWSFPRFLLSYSIISLA
jgi:hypothetical protein